MAQNPGTISTALQNELDDKLRTLEASLAAAAQATSSLRETLPKIAALAQVIGDIEATMTRIRPQIAEEPPVQPAYGQFTEEQSASPWLRPMAKSDPVDTWPSPPATPEPESKASSFFSPPDDDDEEDDDDAEFKPATVSNCLRLDVTTKGASLDLKAVDGAVNETAEVVDVALLDYDGRRASLKVWVSESSDPMTVRDALLEGLQRRFEGEADIEVNFEERSAA